MFKKKSVTSLFQENDSNVPVTIFSNWGTKVECNHRVSEFISIVRDSMGSEIYESEQCYHFQITTINLETFILHCKRNKFIEEFIMLFSDKLPLSIRIDILEDSHCSWIFILKSDL